jgi:PPR repeat family
MNFFVVLSFWFVCLIVPSIFFSLETFIIIIICLGAIICLDVLRAFAKKPSPTSAELIRKMLLHMDTLSNKYPSVKPDYNCHNVYIYALLEAMDRGHLCREKGTMMANTYLEHMMERHDESVHPDIWSFNMVLNAWSKSGVPDHIKRAEDLVVTLETYHANAKSTRHKLKTKPNTNTYNTLLSCYSRSILPNRADLGYQQLQKMKNSTAQPDAITYNIVMNLFAKSRHRNSGGK